MEGDTSTNDMVLALANGLAGNRSLSAQNLKLFQKALNFVCLSLAKMVVKDAEGATKFVTVNVTQAQSAQEAKNVAYTIAQSPLVKTALFASDPNWGRILAAVGRADVEQLNIGAVNIYLDDVCIVRSGGVADDYTEKKGQQIMNQEEIIIKVELGAGDDSATIWTSDLSHEYVRINSEYRS